MAFEHRRHILVPAAGSGSRAATQGPKQYQTLAGRALIVHTLSALAQVPDIDTLAVVVSPHDTQLNALLHNEPTLKQVQVWPVGGDTRAASVSAGYVGRTMRVLVEEPGVARGEADAPDIDGRVYVPITLPVGAFADVKITGFEAYDLLALPAGQTPATRKVAKQAQ